MELENQEIEPSISIAPMIMWILTAFAFGRTHNNNAER